MKNIKIDGRTQRVFVLKETEDSLVYIPVKALFLVDYERFRDMEEKGGELLKTMMNTTLDNGRNALVQYDNIIQVLRYVDGGKKTGVRLMKPSEVIAMAEAETNREKSTVQHETPATPPPAPVRAAEPERSEQDEVDPLAPTPEAPWGYKKDGTPRRRPGPPPTQSE